MRKEIDAIVTRLQTAKGLVDFEEMHDSADQDEQARQSIITSVMDEVLTDAHVLLTELIRDCAAK